MRIIFVSSYLKTLVLGAYEAAESFHEAVAAQAFFGSSRRCMPKPRRSSLHLVLDLLVPRRGLHASQSGSSALDLLLRRFQTRDGSNQATSTKRRFSRHGGGVRMVVVTAPAESLGRRDLRDAAAGGAALLSGGDPGPSSPSPAALPLPLQKARRSSR